MATQINNMAYQALVAASNAAHRNAALATQAIKDIEAQIAQLRVNLERAKDAERMAQNHAQAIDTALTKIDAALDEKVTELDRVSC